MVKPGFLEYADGIIGEILTATGAGVSAKEQFRLTPKQCDEQYKHVSKMDFYPAMLEYMTSGDVIGAVLTREDGDLVADIRKIIPALRKKYMAKAGYTRSDQNGIHCSGSAAEAEKECRRFVSKKVCVGKILRPRGLTGELKVGILTNRPDVFAAVRSIYIGDNEFIVNRGSVQNNFAYLNLEGVNTVELADKFRNKEIYIDAADMPLSADEVLSTELIGFAVLNIKGERIGSVKAVEDYGGGVFFEIAVTGAGYVQIPNEDEFILETDMANKTITLTDNALLEETVI
jgi:16S rRNA processing protein RimM